MRRIVMIPLFLLLGLGFCFEPGGRWVRTGPVISRLSATTGKILLFGAPEGISTLRLEEVGGGWTSEIRSEAENGDLRFELEGLEPERRYRYRILDPHGSLLGRGMFRTAPRDGEGRVRFAAFGDSGGQPWFAYLSDSLGIRPVSWLADLLPGRGKQWDLAGILARREPDLVLHLGDVVYPWGKWEHYPEGYFLPFARILSGRPLVAAIGNHDALEHGAEPLLRMQGRDPRGVPRGNRYFDFAFGPVRFFCFDTITSSFEIGSPQIRWLRERLALAREPWKVVFTHRPFWTSSRSRMDAANRYLRDHVHPLLARYGVALVLSGHDHVYQRYRARDGVVYIISGAGGKSLYELHEDPGLLRAEQVFGFLFVEAGPDSLVARAETLEGRIVDRFRLTRP